MADAFFERERGYVLVGDAKRRAQRHKMLREPPHSRQLARDKCLEGGEKASRGGRRMAAANAERKAPAPCARLRGHGSTRCFFCPPWSGRRLARWPKPLRKPWSRPSQAIPVSRLSVRACERRGRISLL